MEISILATRRDQKNRELVPGISPSIQSEKKAKTKNENEEKWSQLEQKNQPRPSMKTKYCINVILSINEQVYQCQQ